MALDSCTPQLGRSSDERVVAAMTREEKVRLLVGTCKDWNLVPEPAPATIHRPPVPDGYWDNYQGNTATMKGKVSGAAGVSYAIPRLGVPEIVFPSRQPPCLPLRVIRISYIAWEKRLEKKCCTTAWIYCSHRV